MTRYPFGPLEALVLVELGPQLNSIGQPASPSRLVAELLGVDRRQVYRWRQIGVTVDQADVLAVRAHRHPFEVWPELADHDARPCTARGCRTRFVPVSRLDQKWCSTRCRKREWARLAYQRNAAFAAAERARANAYYARWVAPARTRSREVAA